MISSKYIFCGTSSDRLGVDRVEKNISVIKIFEKEFTQYILIDMIGKFEIRDDEIIFNKEYIDSVIKSFGDLNLNEAYFILKIDNDNSRVFYDFSEKIMDHFNKTKIKDKFLSASEWLIKGILE